MAKIRPSSDLRNKYNEISTYCHEHFEPIYITKNGHGDLVVMSIEVFERLTLKADLFPLLNEGIDDIKNNRVIPAADVFKLLEDENNK